MIFGTVSAFERTAPVHGEQPSERMRHVTSCGRSPGSKRDERLLDELQGAAPHDDLARLGEIERDDGDLLDVDVVPHVELRPVREREDADALAGRDPAVQQVPELGALALGVPLPLVVRAARTRAPWRATAPRRGGRRRTPRRSPPRSARRAAPASSAGRSSAAFRARTAARRPRSPAGWCGRSAGRRSSAG